jgi:gliding motility-associated-like protein
MIILNKNFILILAAIGFSVFSAAAQSAGWTVNPSQYEFSMTVTGVLNMEGAISTDGNDRVGAFIGGVCRGVTSPSEYTTSDGFKIVFLQVYSNTIVGETVTFKLYDASAGTLVNAANSLKFQNDATTGTTASPYIITTNQNPTDIALSSMEIMEGKKKGSDIGVFTVTDSDGGPDYSYSIAEGNGNFSIHNDTLASAVVFDYEIQSSHPVLVEVSDGKGGTFQKLFTITITIDPDRFSCNNYISPNGDGKNDVWVIKYPEVYKEYKVTIYNDAGVVVFNSTNYNNDWGGTLDGKRLPTGAYYFIVQSPDHLKKYAGTISLNR